MVQEMNKIFWTKLFYYFFIFSWIAMYIITNILTVLFTESIIEKLLYIIIANPLSIYSILMLSDKRILNGLLHSMKTNKKVNRNE